MTPEEFLDKYFAPEYLNVQDKDGHKQQAKEDLQKVLAHPASS